MCGKRSRSYIILLGIWGFFPFSAMTEDQITFWEDRVSLGGEIRSRGEVKSDFYTADGMADLDDEFFLLRSRLHLDFRPDDTWQIYLEAQDSREFGSGVFHRYDVPNPVEDELDLFQGYLQVNKILQSPISLRIGRQVLSYGRQRLIGGFNWSNVARSFEAVKIMTNLDDFGKVDFFVGQPVIHDWGNFNTTSDGQSGFGDDNTLYGVYSALDNIPYVDFLEGYYLLRDNNNAEDEVHTLGMRTGRRYDSGWDWELEVVGQVGDYHDLNHSAFAMHHECGYTFECPASPRLGSGYSYATGDSDSGDGDHNTFDNLFPTNHLHYGAMDLFSWRNMHDVEFILSAKPIEKLASVLAVHAFFLDESSKDAWFSAGGGTVRLAKDGVDSYVGTEIDLKTRYEVCKYFIVEAGYSHYFAGDHIDDTGERNDADWGYLMAEIPF